MGTAHAEGRATGSKDGAFMNASTQLGEAARLSGKIKWFNRSKGFGFIVPDDGTGDVFLPLAVLERSGFGEAPDGASVSIEWVQGPKGRAATQVLELDASTAQPRPPREGRFRPRDDGGSYQAAPAAAAAATRAAMAAVAVAGPPSCSTAWSNGTTRRAASASSCPMTAARTSSSM